MVPSYDYLRQRQRARKEEAKEEGSPGGNSAGGGSGGGGGYIAEAKRVLSEAMNSRNVEEPDMGDTR